MYYKELWNIVRKNKGLFAGVAFIVIILSLLPLCQSLAVQELVNSLQGGTADNGIGIVPIYIVFMFVMPSVFRQVQSYLNKVLDYVVKTHMVKFVFGKACRVPVKFFENSAQAGLLHRALDVNSGDSQTMILAFVDISVQAITLAVLTIRFGWLGVGLLAVSGSLTWLDECLEYRLRKMDYSFWRDREEPERFCQMLKRLLMNKKSVPELFAYDARSVYVDRLYQQQQKLDDSSRKQNKKRFWYILLVSMIYSIRSGLLYLLIALTACCSVITVPAALGVFAIVGSYGRACSSLIQNITNLRAQKFFCKEFEEMLALPEEEEQGEDEELEICNVEVVFREVCYRYPENDKEALTNIYLRIRQGEKIALVGDNGAGKSTLIRLVLGLDKPTSGEVYLDCPRTGKKYDVNLLRKYTTIMLQNFCKYPYSVRENIAIGGIEQENKMGEGISKDKGIFTSQEKGMGKRKSVKEIVDQLELQEMVEKMPNQLETEIISEGILSGGEWQMVALSRAYIKNGSFVILDEPTAAMDAKREIWLYRKFLDLIKEHTAVIVSHRLPVCQICDRILVMQSGRIIESGTHEELLKQGGCYAEMYEQQSVMYR